MHSAVMWFNRSWIAALNNLISALSAFKMHDVFLLSLSVLYFVFCWPLTRIHWTACRYQTRSKTMHSALQSQLGFSFQSLWVCVVCASCFKKIFSARQGFSTQVSATGPETLLKVEFYQLVLISFFCCSVQIHFADYFWCNVLKFNSTFNVEM